MIRGLVSATNAPTRERVAAAERVTGQCTRPPYDGPRTRFEIGVGPNRNRRRQWPMIFPVRRPTLRERDFHRITAVVLLRLVLIVVRGAAVRLTGSGLGCTDWPDCEKGHFVAPWE